MNHYLFCISYSGSSFSGWQRLSKKRDTIQEILETVLSEYTSEKIKIHGSGRTDAGVNALRQYADFFCDTILIKNHHSKTVIEQLNSQLPADLRILSLQNVSESFHSRKSCKAKTYQYLVSLSERSDVFIRKYIYQPYDPLYPVPDLLNNKGTLITPNLEKMRLAAGHLIGEHDYSAFTTDKTPGKSHKRIISSIDFKTVTLPSGNRILVMKFTGNGFLYHMVRILAGTLLEVGYGHIDAHNIPHIVKAGVRKNAGPTLPAHALFLYDVYYDDRYSIHKVNDVNFF